MDSSQSQRREREGRGSTVKLGFGGEIGESGQGSEKRVVSCHSPSSLLYHVLPFVIFGLILFVSFWALILVGPKRQTFSGLYVT